MGKKQNKCKLCSVKKKNWEGEKFFGINCKKHFVPMIVIKEHKKKISETEYKIIEEIVKARYPSFKLNSKLSDSEDHWHIHLKRK